MNNGISYSLNAPKLQELCLSGAERVRHDAERLYLWKYSRDEGLVEAHYIGYYSFALNYRALT